MTEPNVQQAVPFFWVSNLEASLRFYLDGHGFEMKNKWIDEGKLRWCCLDLGEAALMLQEFRERPAGRVGEGVAIYFTCNHALTIFHEITSRGIKAPRPFVGNHMWVTQVTDPDGYRLAFESPTDVPEDTVYSDV